mgnify:CR=1 FL=1
MVTTSKATKKNLDILHIQDDKHDHWKSRFPKNKSENNKKKNKKVPLGKY